MLETMLLGDSYTQFRGNARDSAQINLTRQVGHDAAPIQPE